jgi:hypothetical protein
MLPLNVFEEGRHIWPPEMVDSLESCKHTFVGYSLEVVFTDVKHRRSQVKLVEELGDENVDFENVSHISPFNVSQDIDEPLKVSMRLTDPQEVDLLASNSGISIG